MNINKKKAFSKLLRIIKNLRKEVAAINPDGEWQEYMLMCLQEFFNEIENNSIYCIEEVGRRSSAYEKFEAVYFMFINFSYFNPTQSENPKLDPPSFGRCLELVREILGEEDAQTLCRAMNEFIIQILKEKGE